MLEKDVLGLPLFVDPMVDEANVFDTASHVRLSDSLLNHHLRFLQRSAPPESLLVRELRTHRFIFPEVPRSKRIPEVWNWSDLVTPVQNVGTVREAEKYAYQLLMYGIPAAYLTGGLEFTRGQLLAMRYLFRKGYHIIMGQEPYVYPAGKGRRFGAITLSCVPMSFWSKVMGERGFVFTIPRPLPIDEAGINSFYDDLYARITRRKIPIVVSEHDPFIQEKRKRGPVIEVPIFDRPSTTDLFWSAVI